MEIIDREDFENAEPYDSKEELGKIPLITEKDIEAFHVYFLSITVCL